MSYVNLNHEQRLALAALLRAGHSQADIARQLGVHRSTIHNELERNGENGQYEAGVAKRKTKERRRQANQRFRKIDNNLELEKYIIKKLRKYWSPEQIAGWLKRKCQKTIVCHETIYQFIYQQRPDLKKYLRCQKGKYRKRYGTKKREKMREFLKKKWIGQRPAIVEARERLGDWEGDLIIGGEKSTALLTHVERKSGYLLADKLQKKGAEIVKQITIQRFRKIAKAKRLTCTYDNDGVFVEHELIEKATGMTVYFANPYHSWERGSNENANGLLRQFFPKKTAFANIAQKEINKKVWLINTRPRKRLHYLTPAEVFNDCCALD